MNSALATLHVDPDTGLTQVEVAARRKGHPVLAFLGSATLLAARLKKG